MAFVPLQEKKTVNTEWYIKLCHALGLRGWECLSSKQRYPLSAPPSSTTTQVLTPPPPLWTTWKQIAFTWSPRPRNPRLAPCDFFLFPRVKQQLKGKQFQGVEEARAFSEGVVSDTPQSTWSASMVTRFERMTKRVNVEGDYFEKNWTRVEIRTCAQISTSRNLRGDPRKQFVTHCTTISIKELCFCGIIH